MSWWLIAAWMGGLVIAFWVGHWRGWSDHADRINGVMPETPGEEDVVWCYRNVLNRAPESGAYLRDWAAMKLPRSALARKFMQTPEYQRQSPDGKRAAQAAVARLH